MVADKLTSLRKEMKALKIQGYMIPRADEYLGEFVAPYAERLSYISGFTGSAGLCIIMRETAIVLSDARYTLQMKNQVDQNHFITGDYIQTPVTEWIKEHSPRSATIIGYDPKLHTSSQIKTWQQQLENTRITLQPIEGNLIDSIWPDQPEPPKGEIELFDECFAGLSAQEKISLICESVGAAEGAILLTALDSICWLLNVRGSDTDYIPQILSTALIDIRDRHVHWFVDASKVTTEIMSTLGPYVTFYDPASLPSVMAQLAGHVYIDTKRAPIWYEAHLKANNKVMIMECKDPCILPKAQKNEAEQQAIKDTHIADGIALVCFMKWLEDQVRNKEDLNEYDVSEMLEVFRADHPDFRGNSFPTICGFGSNAAIVHYRATKEQHSPIGRDNLLLIDSGGQYLGSSFAGTTDITRTLLIGKPSQAMKENFTRVLQGHIGVATACFPQGTTGAQIDAYARRALWQEGLDYGHGTGHGVGCYLAVHEEATSISSRCLDPILPGMLISNEPGYYEAGAYGIRIENLVLVTELGANFATGTPMLGFETVSFAPIERDLIVKKMLSPAERIWINDYHKAVYAKLSPALERPERDWLKRKTKSI